jgi:hypothetical protein
MAEVKNPRAGGANTGRTGLTGDAARIAEINIALRELDATMQANRPGTPKYEAAKKKYQTLNAEKTKLLDKGKAEVTAKKNKAQANKVQQIEDDIQRAKDKGEDTTALEAELEKEKAKTAAGAGDSAQKDSDKDGVPDLIDNLPNYPNPDQKTGTGTTTKPKVTSASTAKPGVGDGAVGDGKTDDKQLWISYLRTVFATLEDKEQKAELDRIFDIAKKQKWDEKTFMENLKNTAWWQKTLPSLRQFLLESKDPRNAGMFAEKVKNNIDDITAKLEALGIARTKIDPVTGKVIDNTEYIQGLALEAIKNNWTDDQLENWLATKGDFLFTGGGTIGSNYDRINQMAYMYGISLDDNMKKAINTSLLDPLDGRDAQYWLNSVKEMAYDAPQNKPFAEALRAGRSLYEVTSSYRNQMASLLEVDSTAITWDDLMGKVLDKDSGNARTFADFTKALKQDPLWQYTRNAKETYSGMALDLAKMFGFAG